MKLCVTFEKDFKQRYRTTLNNEQLLFCNVRWRKVQVFLVFDNNSNLQITHLSLSLANIFSNQYNCLINDPSYWKITLPEIIETIFLIK
jgi:hypothetical protein